MSTLNNLVILRGIIGKVPEIRHNDDSSVVANMVLATKEFYKDRSGERKEKTTWHNLTAWGEVAKGVEKLIKKGSLILVIGKNQVDCWEKDGQKKYKSYVQISEFDIIREPRKEDNDMSHI